MLRKLACAVAVLAFGFSVATAEEIFGSIKKVDGKEISVTKFKKGEKKGEDVVLKLADKVKVVSAKFNREEKKIEPGDELEGGLKNARFEKIGKGGIFARIITNDDGVVTEIQVMPAFKGKGKGKKKPNDDK